MMMAAGTYVPAMSQGAYNYDERKGSTGVPSLVNGTGGR
jgi:hypothetical protein